jgi:spermidine synthase
VSARSALWKLRGVVALSGAILMALEILGSRVLAPRFGSSVFVWGALITTFLLALALGYWLGGLLADRRPEEATLSIILSAAAALVLPAIVWARPLLEALGRSGLETRWAALAASLALFLPPSLAMGMVSPVAVRIAVRELTTVGSVAGGYAALSTAGSILGTLATAFFLIPIFPVPTLLIGLSFGLAGGALLTSTRLPSRVAAVLALAASLAAVWTDTARGGTRHEVVLFERDTAYHHVVVTELYGIRYLRFDASTQSGMRLDRPERSLMMYDEAFFAAWAARPSIRRVCLVGLGAASFNRMLQRAIPETIVDSVEIDPVVLDVAQRFFQYRPSPRDRPIVADGRVFLSQAGEPYDLVVLDAYNASGIPFHLLTAEFFDTVRGRLSREGVFVANIAGKYMGPDSRLFWAVYRTIRRHFGQVYVMNPDLAAGRSTFQGNLILLATVSADPIPLETLREKAADLARRWNLKSLPEYAGMLIHSPEPPPGTHELTDRMAPVEALQAD